MVCKEFEAPIGWVDGQICSYDPSSATPYLVAYNDMEEEYLTLGEVEAILLTDSDEAAFLNSPGSSQGSVNTEDRNHISSMLTEFLSPDPEAGLVSLQ